MSDLSSLREKHWILTCCPRTGEEVVGSSQSKTLPIPGGQALWWFCPACCGWHLKMIREPAGLSNGSEKLGMVRTEPAGRFL